MSTEVESLELKIKSNSTDAVNGIDALTQSLSRLKTATKNLGLSGVAKDIGKVAKATDESSKSNKAASASFTDLYNKLRLTAKGFEMVGKKIWSAVEKSMDYTENMNLFTVSMGEYAGEAMEYAETVSEVMGIDTSDWIRSQGVFMTLATGFGVAGDRAATMSKNLTQLGYDLASFYNLDTEDAMQKLQSGLSGELEPLRRIGYDLSQAKLEATALALGIDKSVSSMTQAEKAQLRYYAIMTQVTVAQGDMARTLNDPANQMRVFKAEVNMAAREIGNVFIPALNAILPYATAAMRVLGTLGKIIAGLFGYKSDGISEGVSAVVDGTSTVSGNLEDAQDEAKKLKSYMLGFDELNVINPNEGSSSSADDALSGFDFELPEYDFMADLVESKVATIVEEMKEWLGITDDIDTWAELLDTRLGDILKTVGLIGAGVALWKVSKTFIDSITALNTILSSPAYAITISAILTITGIVLAFEGMEDAVQKGLDGFNFAEIIGGSLLGAGGAALLGSKIATWITTAFAGGAVDLAITQAGINLGLGTVAATGAALAAGVAGIILGIPMMFVGIYDAIVDKIGWLNSLLVGLGATAAGAGIGTIIGALGGPIGAGIGALIGLAVGFVVDGVLAIVDIIKNGLDWSNGLILAAVAVGLAILTGGITIIPTLVVGAIALIVTYWDELVAWLDTYVIQPVTAFFKGLWESVSGFFSSLWKDIKAVWDAVSSWFEKNVIDPVVSFFEGAALRIGQFLEGCWIIIQAVWLLASTWFNDTVVEPVVGLFKELWESVSGFFAQLWKDISATWKAVSKWFNDTVVKPVVEYFKGLWTDISGFFASLWDEISLLWGAAYTWFDETIITPVKSVFKALCEDIGGFFSSLWLGIRRDAVSAMNAVIGAIESAINWVVDGINSLIGGFNDVVHWAADLIGEDWGGVTLIPKVSFSRIAMPTYAEGGFPEQGQMFIAREAGAEMVGNIGRRTAVANNDQIVAGIAGGVAEANEEQNVLLREQNSLLRAILEKDSGVYLDGKNLTNSVEKYQRERGRVLIAGGVL